jgi:hypothetical protein
VDVVQQAQRNLDVLAFLGVFPLEAALLVELRWAPVGN